MISQSLVENLNIILKAPDGISLVERLFLDLAVNGKMKLISKEFGTYKVHKLGDVCDLYQPKTISTSQLIPDGNYPVYGANGVIGRFDKFNHEDSEILVTCRGATCGTVNISQPFSWINGNAMVVRPKHEWLRRDFLALVLKSINYEKVITGTAQPQITRAPLSKVEIIVPSPEAQEAVVTTMNGIFRLLQEIRDANSALSLLQTSARKSSVDAISTTQTQEELQIAWERIKNNWEVIAGTRESVTSLRQLLVDLAIQGQLFGRRPIGSHGYPAAWEVNDFRSIGNIEGGNQPPKSVFISEPREGYVQLFQIRDLGPNPIPVFIPNDLARSTSVEGEILIGRYGASVGKIFRAKTGAYNVALVKFIYPKEKLDSEFVYWFLKSSRSQALFTGMSRSAQAGFNKRDLAPLLIPIPSKTEQQEIIERLNSLMKICDQLESSFLNASELAGKFARSVSSVSA